MIKVLKPGIEDVLVADLNFVYVVSRILEFLSPDLSRVSLVCLAACLLDGFIYFPSSMSTSSLYLMDLSVTLNDNLDY